MTTTTIKLPDSEGTAVTLLDGRIVFVSVRQDPDCSNPLDGDGMGGIRSLSRRDTDRISGEEFEALTGFDPGDCSFEGGTDPDAVVLSYYEHGNHMWFVMGDSKPGVEFRWDGVLVAGLWQPDDALKEEVEGLGWAERAARMEEFARQACEEYTKWGNGECYGYSVLVHALRLDGAGEPYDREADYRRDEPLHEDACWGFVGWDCVLEAVKDAVGGIPEA